MKITIIAGDIIPKRLGYRCEAVAYCPYIKDSMIPKENFNSDVFTKDVEVSFKRQLLTGAESCGTAGYEYTYAVYEPLHEETNADYIGAIRKLVMDDGFQRMLNEQQGGNMS